MKKYLDTVWPYSKYQFSIWRLCFGLYLTTYAIWLVPYATAIYSDEGMLSELFFPALFPSPLIISADPLIVYGLMVLHVLGAVGIWLGIYRHTAALLYLFSAASFLQWNNFTEDPSLSFVHLAIALTLLIPATEPFQLFPARTKEKWQMPFFVYLTALVAMGLGYTVSGIDKFHAEGWRVGDAMYHLYRLAVAHDTWFIDILRAQPAWLIAIQTYAAGTAMLVALPLLLIRKTRVFMWLTLTGMFLFTLLVFDLWQVSLGMLLFHFFVFDRAWVKPKKGTLRLYYDGACPFCRAFVRFVMYEDTLGQITATPLQDQPQKDRCYDSILVMDDDTQYERSSAVRVLLSHIGGLWRIIAMLAVIVPVQIADKVYLFVGQHRYVISRWIA